MLLTRRRGRRRLHLTTPGLTTPGLTTPGLNSLGLTTLGLNSLGLARALRGLRVAASAVGAHCLRARAAAIGLIESAAFEDEAHWIEDAAVGVATLGADLDRVVGDLLPG